jgi:hypothetical protein
MRGNRNLNKAIMESVDNQIRDLDPPETKQAHDRLLSEGFSEEDAKRLIGCVVATDIHYVLKDNQPFDVVRFVKGLSELPELPED